MIRLSACFFCLWFPVALLAAEGEQAFSILFDHGKVSFSGQMKQKSDADSLANAIITARPDLRVVNGGLTFSDKATLPDLELLTALAVEVGLSTHEGEITITDDHFLVGGLTDSVVTLSVLKLRAEPILEGRKFREQICLIPTDDQPSIPILLSSGETRKPFTFDLDLVEAKTFSFEAPGIKLEKLRSLIEGTDDIDLLLTGKPSPPEGEKPTVEVAKVEMSDSESLPTDPGETTEVVEVASDPFVDIGPILYGRNSFLLQTGQKENVERVIAALKSPFWTGKPIQIRGKVYQSGSDAFATWLCERRVTDLMRRLEEGGIGKDLISEITEKSTETIDTGEINVLLPRPDSPVPPLEKSE